LFEIAPAKPIVRAVEADKFAKLSFEAALARLESVVDAMEQGETPLADLLAKYEEGAKLLRLCEARLKDAEMKIEKLKKMKDGSVSLEPLPANRAD
jgi:exodeoxyribonuclease VII small subunit